MSVENTAFDDPIGTKISWAEVRYREHKDRLRDDPEVARLLPELQDRVRASQQARIEAGIATMCATCEREKGGSCCGADLEDRHDGVMLLVNLLLGAALPREPRGPKDCLFLGENGCMLVVKDMLCVNFLCKTVTDEIAPEKIAVMRDREGEEIVILFSLHARLSTMLRELSDS